MGIVMQRRKRRQAARMRSGLMMIAALAVIALLAVSPEIRSGLAGFADGMQVFAQSTQIEMTLPEYSVYALQLAVFDNGDRAAAEAKRLQAEGVRCVIWHREKMRIVVSAAFERDALDANAARGYEAYIIRDTLPAVSLRLSAQAEDAQHAQALIKAPDTAFQAMMDRKQALNEIVDGTRLLAADAQDAHPENALYTQLAQSLVSWCDAMEKLLKEAGEDEARSYGAVSMCTICRQLRQVLSEPSTASAQRTPSTAAEVMPPA